MPGQGRAGARKTSGRIAGNCRGAPEPFFQKMVGEVLQAGLNAPVVFAGDEHKTVGAADLSGQPLQPLGRLPLRMFLVHPVEHRQIDRLGVDQFDVIATGAKTLDDELREPDAHAVGTVGAVEDENAVAHDGTRLSRHGPTGEIERSSSAPKAPKVGFVLRTMFGGVRRHREASDKAEQAKGDEAEGPHHADPMKNAVHAVTSRIGRGAGPTGSTAGGAARWPGSRPPDSPNLSTSAPCFGQTRLAVWRMGSGV